MLAKPFEIMQVFRRRTRGTCVRSRAWLRPTSLTRMSSGPSARRSSRTTRCGFKGKRRSPTPRESLRMTSRSTLARLIPRASPRADARAAIRTSEVARRPHAHGHLVRRIHPPPATGRRARCVCRGRVSSAPARTRRGRSRRQMTTPRGRARTRRVVLLETGRCRGRAGGRRQAPLAHERLPTGMPSALGEVAERRVGPSARHAIPARMIGSRASEMIRAARSICCSSARSEKGLLRHERNRPAGASASGHVLGQVEVRGPRLLGLRHLGRPAHGLGHDARRRAPRFHFTAGRKSAEQVEVLVRTPCGSAGARLRGDGDDRPCGPCWRRPHR